MTEDADTTDDAMLVAGRNALRDAVNAAAAAARFAHEVTAAYRRTDRWESDIAARAHATMRSQRGPMQRAWPPMPLGIANLVPPPPWHYVGDMLVIAYQADPAAVAAVLPPGLASASCIQYPLGAHRDEPRWAPQRTDYGLRVRREAGRFTMSASLTSRPDITPA